MAKLSVPRAQWNNWRKTASQAATRLLDLALPPLCLACRTPVSDHGALCPTCWNRITFITAPVCERLGTPLPCDLGPGALSAEAIAHPPAFDRARAAFLFDDVGRQLIHELKFGDRLTIAPALATWMGRAGQDLLRDADLLIPVPLHWTRLFRRRYNQAALLAQHLSRQHGLASAPLALRRIRRTPHQTGLDRDDRHSNVADAFRIHDEELHRIVGARIVLVDDVLTTGATLDACARLLRRAGARRIDALVAARVVEPRR